MKTHVYKYWLLNFSSYLDYILRCSFVGGASELWCSEFLYPELLVLNKSWDSSKWAGRWSYSWNIQTFSLTAYLTAPKLNAEIMTTACHKAQNNFVSPKVEKKERNIYKTDLQHLCGLIRLLFNNSDSTLSCCWGL